MRLHLLAAVSAAALGLAAAPAFASGVTGYIDGGYAYTNVTGGGSGHIDDWNIKGSLNAPFGGSAFSGQLDAGYNSLNGSSGISGHIDGGSVSVMWTNPMVRVGATAGTNELGGSGVGSGHFNNYGGFVTWYPTSQITLGVKGASINCSGCSGDSVWGGRILGYATPNIALNFDYDTFQSSTGHFDTYSGGAEWQPTASPWTVRAGYSSTKVFGQTAQTWNVNFRWYFNGTGTLVQHQRGGDEPWGTQIDPFRYVTGTP